MRSVGQEVRRFGRYARNRVHPLGLRDGALAVPSRFRPPSHRYAGHAGPWIEEAFFAFWRARRPQGIDRIYVPVFWTDYYLRRGRRSPHPELQALLDESLEPDRAYFTLVQNDDGILERLPANVLVFGAGAGDVPIPLLGPRPQPRERPRDIFCSFMGATEGPSNRFGVRSSLVSALSGKPGFSFGRGSYQQFVDVTSRSTFVLCPRGYGPSSYRLFEAMALGAVPVYVWAEVEWLPWRDELDWSELCVSVNLDDIEWIPDILRAHSPAQIDAMRRQNADLFEEYFTLRGTCERVLERLGDGAL
jgi:hypothetical protein